MASDASAAVSRHIRADAAGGSAMSGVLHERIVTLCDELKFQAVADVYADLADVAAKQESSYIEYLERVLKAENELRQGRSRHTMAKMAGFPAIKTLED